jgi:peptide deformylase
LQIITYPHPTLRHVSKPIKRVDAELRRIIAEMFDLMYQNKGIGLAANQVDLPLRLFVINLAGERGQGEEQVFINPVISRPKGSDEAEEGCLSIPEVYGPVIRPKQVRAFYYTLSGKEVERDLTEMEARCVQHELDHLNGVLFPDRMTDSAKMNIRDELTEFEVEFQSKRTTGELPSDAEIAARIKEWEERYA